MITDSFLITVQNMELSEILLWLLSFAVLFGILEQANMPNSKSARALISIGIAFLVIMSAPNSLVPVLSSMSSGLILVGLGLLVLIIFFEVTGIKFGKDVLGKDGKPIASAPVSLFEKYGYIFAIAFALIAILIFVNSGGLTLLGWNINLSSASNITVIFLSLIIIAVLWMVKD